MIYRNVSNSVWHWVLITTFLCVFTLPAQAAIPDNIDYQGYLTDSGGSPINGPVSITFSLYNVVLGGLPLKTVTLPAVNVTNGLFSVKLSGPFPAGMFDAPLWLGIDVAADGEMSPRIELSSAAFAHKADDAYTLDGISASSLDQSAHVGDTGNPHSVTAAQTGAVSSANFALHTSDASAHHAKTTSFTDLTDQASNAQIPAAIARDAEIMPTVFANDGPGSGLNADLLDGLNSTAFMSAGSDNWVNTTGDTMTGNLGVLANVGIGITAPFYSLDVRRGSNNYLGFFANDNNTGGGIALGLYGLGDARGTGTGYGRGGTFYAYGGSTSGNAYATLNYAYAYGASTAYGVYSNATFGTTTGREYAFYGVGDGYFSGNVGIGTTAPTSPLTLTGNFAMTNGILNSGVSSLANTWYRAAFYQPTAGSGSSIFLLTADSGNTGSSGAQFSLSSGANPTIDIANREAGGITFRTNGYTERMRVTTSGNVGIGTTTPAAKLDVAGTTRTDVLIIDGGADLAEPFDVSGTETILPGMVLAIDSENPGLLRIANTAYDRKVAGVVSGANGINSGLVMSQSGSEADGSHPIALTGRVYAMADASYGAIQPGDMLTTSNTPGHVMKVTNYQKAYGTIIGKAMSALDEGTGLVLVLVNLQ